MLSPIRKLLKTIHPEGIPFPGTVFYNAISETRIFQRHYERVADDILTFCTKGHLLDIGTGPGWLLVKLHEKSPDLSLTGLDISASMVATAQRNIRRLGLADHITFKEGSAANLPFGSNSFDVVVSTGSLHHWKEPVRGLTEVYRVLCPGGYALIYDLASDTPFSVLKKAAREFGGFRMLLMWLHAFEEPFYSYEGLRSLPCPTAFRQGTIRFVGVLCCLMLKKPGL